MDATNDATEVAGVDEPSADAPGFRRKISLRWERRMAALQPYLVLFGVIVTVPIVVFALVRTRQRAS